MTHICKCRSLLIDDNRDLLAGLLTSLLLISAFAILSRQRKDQPGRKPSQ